QSPHPLSTLLAQARRGRASACAQSGDDTRREERIMLSGKILKANGWPEGKVIGLAKAAAERMEREGASQAEILAQLEPVRLNPGAYLADPRFADLAREVIRRTAPVERQDDIALR